MSADRRISPEDIRRVADAADILEVFSGRIALKKTGATYMALCPSHQEKTPSFVVSPARQTFKCFGCGIGGDAIAAEMMLEGLDFPGAVYSLAQRKGIIVEGADIASEIPASPPPRRPMPAMPESPGKPLALRFDLHLGTRANLASVATLRGLSVEGVALARDRGLLWFGSSCGVPAWFVTDGERINAQARRMDGQPFPAFKDLGVRKAHTVGGSQARRPIGIKEASDKPFIALVEGGPDLLAGHHFIVAEEREADVATVAVLGAANRLPEDALLLLANKRVRIFPHADAAGALAALRWTEQLEGVGCTVDAFRFDGLLQSDGEPVKDLNDLAAIDADCFEQERGDLERILPE